MVRHFLSGVGHNGGRPGYVGSLVSRQGASLHQPQGAVGGGEGSFQAPERSEGTCGGSVLRQHHSGGLSQAPRRHAASHAQQGGTADSLLGGAGGVTMSYNERGASKTC